MLPKAKKKVGCCGRPTEDLQAIFNAILYVLRSGCSWRMLPNDFPKWETVYGYFNRWSKANVWKKINGMLVREVRKNTKRPGKKKKVLRKDDVKGFIVIPRRWVVAAVELREHLRGYQLSKDYERLTQNSESMIYLAMIPIMLKRLD